MGNLVPLKIFNGTVETFGADDGIFIPAGEQPKHKLQVHTDVSNSSWWKVPNHSPDRLLLTLNRL
jgi:hypothetical protein